MRVHAYESFYPNYEITVEALHEPVREMVMLVHVMDDLNKRVVRDD